MDSPGTSPPTSARTRSAAIVDEIEQEIVGLGWPVGELLGQEASLMERFNVSRAVMREAIRTLESSGVVTVRTGRRGGLFVDAPNVTALKRAASLYLDYAGFEPRHLYTTWFVLESALIEQVVALASEQELDDLLACQRADAERGVEGVERSSFIPMLAHLARNPLLELFFQMTTDLAMVHGRDMTPRVVAWFNGRYRAMAEAIAARDSARAIEILSGFLHRLEAAESVVPQRRTRR